MQSNKLLLILCVTGLVIAGCKKKKPKQVAGKTVHATAVTGKTRRPRVVRHRSHVARKHVATRPVVRKMRNRIARPIPKALPKTPVHRLALQGRHVVTPPRQTRPPKKLVPDVRLLLTVADIEDLGLKPNQYERVALPGKLPGPHYDSLYYRLKKKDFGIAIQVWAFKSRIQAIAKYRNLFAELPNARTIDPVAGDTLFAYWGDVIYVGFVHPRQKVVVNLACSKKLCSSDKLYEIAKRVVNHLDLLFH